MVKSTIETKINKDKIIPKPLSYLKVFFSVLIVLYIVKPLLLLVIPQIEKLPELIYLLIWIVIIVYLKELIDVKIGGYDYF